MRGPHSYVLSLSLMLSRVYPAQTEIAQFYIPVLVNQNIRAFEITMKNIFSM